MREKIEIEQPAPRFGPNPEAPSQPEDGWVEDGRVEDWMKREMFRRTLDMASAAHEMKTPLVVMTGYTDLLLAGHLGPLTEAQRAVLIDMRENTDRLQRFIQGFLNFSALESGRIKLNKSHGQVNECVAEVVGHWKSLFDQRGTVCQFLPGPGLRRTAFDDLKLQHVVSNLLDNALKFTPPGGRVTVTTQNYLWERRSFRQNLHVPVPKERRNGARKPDFNAVRIDVADNGPGIAPEFHQDIFGEFLQIEPSRKGSGMGLGLAIARRLVDAHAGKIWVESKSGAGATFSVLLPVMDE